MGEQISEGQSLIGVGQSPAIIGETNHDVTIFRGLRALRTRIREACVPASTSKLALLMAFARAEGLPRDLEGKLPSPGPMP